MSAIFPPQPPAAMQTAQRSMPLRVPTPPLVTVETIQVTMPPKRVIDTRPNSLIILVGVYLFIILISIPCWNASILLQDENFVFWAGKGAPTGIIIGCILVVALYVGATVAYLKYVDPEMQSDQLLLMLFTSIITVLGLVLFFGGLPLTRIAEQTYNNLMYRCDYSPQTHRLYEYAQVLQNIRAMPTCVSQYSVEICTGYEDVPPYTPFLKSMEKTKQCAGFCYQNLTRAADWLAPVLFSTDTNKVSCHGMLARDMRDLAGNIGLQTMYYGVLLMAIAIGAGLLQLVGLCIRTRNDFEPLYFKQRV